MTIYTNFTVSACGLSYQTLPSWGVSWPLLTNHYTGLHCSRLVKADPVPDLHHQPKETVFAEPEQSTQTESRQSDNTEALIALHGPRVCRRADAKMAMFLESMAQVGWYFSSVTGDQTFRQFWASSSKWVIVRLVSFRINQSTIAFCLQS